MDLLLVTSDNEGGPLTVLEAMACGVPCISTPVGLVPQAIRSGQNGYIVPRGNIEEFVKAILELAKDKEQHRRFAQSARQHVVDNFDWQITLQPTREFYLRARKREGLGGELANSHLFRSLADRANRLQVGFSELDEALFLARLGYRRAALRKVIRGVGTSVDHLPSKMLVKVAKSLLFGGSNIPGEVFLRESLSAKK